MKRILVILSISISTLTSANSQTETIVVDAGSLQDSTTAVMQGFINGGASYNVPQTVQLNPQFWSFGWDIVADYDYITPSVPLVKTASIYSAYMNYFGIGDPMTLQPWTDGYAQWDFFVTGMVNQSIASSRPIDFWSVWGEPDASFSGTPEQYVELFRRTDSIIHSIQPTAKLVGPDLIHFGIAQLITFADTLHDLGIHPAAYSWHEFGDFPEQMPAHTQQFRDSLLVRPWAGTPEIHIQEYGDPNNRLVPAWAVGWLHYFEQAKVDWASRGCFNESDGVNIWDDCWDGLSGMYMQDGITTQPLYWVHRAYGDLGNTTRITTTNTQPRTVAMAGKNDSNQEMKLLVGRYSSIYQGIPDPSANVNIRIRNYPYGANSTQPILVQRIPAQSSVYSQPLSAPITIINSMVNFIGDSALINLAGFADGDAYVIYINPEPNSILSNESLIKEFYYSVYPNPASSFVKIQMDGTSIVDLEITNIHGQVIRKKLSDKYGSIYVSTDELENGIYFVKFLDGAGGIHSNKFVVNH